MVSWITPSVLEAQYEAENGTQEDILEAAQSPGLFIHGRTFASHSNAISFMKALPKAKGRHEAQLEHLHKKRDCKGERMEVWQNFVDDIKELDELEKPIPWQHLVCGLRFSGLFKETQAKNERRKSRSTYSMKGI